MKQDINYTFLKQKEQILPPIQQYLPLFRRYFYTILLAISAICPFCGNKKDKSEI